MKLYDTMARAVREFTPLQPGQVSLYTCGPTVYDYQHIGNYSGYIYWDVLVRTLEQQGYNVNWYMNITDVGHLVSDADEGEDKLEKGAKREGKTAWEVADFYLADFVAGLQKLGIHVPLDHLPRATAHIPEQIELIKQLEAKGYTYKTDDGVYFDSTKFADYGKLARLDIEGLQAGARVAVGEKHHPTDFALWKFSPTDRQRDMEWDSPWGKGFPGWHIECSAMSMKYLGETLDIHAGGIDHIPVHHTNEIAQSEAATGKTFVDYWLHNNHLLVDDAKIAKSDGNGITLQNLEAKGFTPIQLRLLILQSHFRSQANFSWQNLNAAKQRLQRWQNLADLRWQLVDNEIPGQADKLTQSQEQVIARLTDDLDTPGALAAAEVGFDAMEAGLSKQAEPAARQFLESLDQLLGLTLLASADIGSEQQALITQREAVRQQQNWTAADELRQKLTEQGIELRDTDYGSFWERKVS